MHVHRHLVTSLISFAIVALGFATPASAFHTKIVPGVEQIQVDLLKSPIAQHITGLSHSQWTAIAAWLASNTVETAPQDSNTYETQAFGRVLRVNVFGPGRCDVRKTRLCVEGKPVAGRLEITAVDRQRASTLYYEAQDDDLALMAFWFEAVASGAAMDAIGIRSDSDAHWMVGARSTFMARSTDNASSRLPTKDLDGFMSLFNPSTMNRVLDSLEASDVTHMPNSTMTAFMKAAAAPSGSTSSALLPVFRTNHASIATTFIRVMTASGGDNTSSKALALSPAPRAAVGIAPRLNGAAGPVACPSPSSASSASATAVSHIAPLGASLKTPQARTHPVVDSVEAGLQRWLSGMETLRSQRANAFHYFSFNRIEIGDVFGL